MKWLNKKFIIIGVFCLVATAVVARFYRPVSHIILRTPALEKLRQEKETKVITEVNKIFALPTGEKPTVLTVANSYKLPKQSFFDSATDDDIILLYAKTKKAIIYRPSINKIIDAATLIDNNIKEGNDEISTSK